MKCEYCGRVLKPGEYNCPGCGATVENPEPVYNTNTQGMSSGGTKIEVKVGGVNISIDGTTGHVGTQTPPPVRPTPPPVRQTPPPVPPTYTQAGSNVQNNPMQKVRYGGFFARALAAWIDGVVCCIVAVILMIAVSPEESMWLVVVFWHAYFVICEAFCDGATLGKKGMCLKVVNNHYEKITLGQAILRTVSKYISAAIFYIGFLMVLFSNKKRGLHDIIANTYVVKS